MYRLTCVLPLIRGGSEGLRHSWVAFRIFWGKRVEVQQFNCTFRLMYLLSLRINIANIFISVF